MWFAFLPYKNKVNICTHFYMTDFLFFPSYSYTKDNWCKLSSAEEVRPTFQICQSADDSFQYCCYYYQQLRCSTCCTSVWIGLFFFFCKKNSEFTQHFVRIFVHWIYCKCLYPWNVFLDKIQNHIGLLCECVCVKNGPRIFRLFGRFVV